MVHEDDIIIEDKYGSGRNINDLIDIDHPNFKNVEILEKSNISNEINKEEKENSIQDNFFKSEDKIIVNDILDSSGELKIEAKKEIFPISKKQFSFKWYLKNSTLGIFFIVVFNILVILLKNNSNMGFISSMRIPLEILVFFGISFFIIKIKKQFPKISGLTCAYTGLFSGIFISLFEMFYNLKLWTIFNLVTEAIFLSLEGFFAGLIFGALLYSVDESLKNSINK